MLTTRRGEGGVGAAPDGTVGAEPLRRVRVAPDNGGRGNGGWDEVTVWNEAYVEFSCAYRSKVKTQMNPPFHLSAVRAIRRRCVNESNANRLARQLDPTTVHVVC